jgi:hypothetical protein
MNYLDYRLSKILSDNRIDQSRPIGDRKLRERRERRDGRLGLSLIADEERSVGHEPRAA